MRERLQRALGAPRLATGDRHRRGLRDPDCGGGRRERDFGEDLPAGEVHAHRAKLVPVQPRRGGRAAAAHLRAGGRQPLPGGRVAVRAGWMQTDPLHPADVCGSVRVHPDRSVC